MQPTPVSPVIDGTSPLGEDVLGFIEQIKTLQNNKIPGEDEAIAQLIRQALQAVVAGDQGNAEVTTEDSEEKRTAVARIFSQTIETLKAQNGLDTSDFDAEKSIRDYADAYHQYQLLCIPYNTASSGEGWRPSNYGAYSCNTIFQMDVQVKDLVVRSPGSRGNVPKGIVRFFDWVNSLHLSPSAGPLVSYEVNPGRTYLGIGGSIEVIKALPKNPNIVFGTELEIVARAGLSNPNIFDTELKTIEGVDFPVLFEGGYRNDHLTLLFQAGGWFTYSHLFDAEQERDPYSPDFFANGNLRLGVKTYLVKSHLRIAAGYQANPWGSGAYTEFGYQFGGKHE